MWQIDKIFLLPRFSQSFHWSPISSPTPPGNWTLLSGYVQTGATTPNNAGSCRPTMLRPIARGYTFDRFQTLRHNTQQHSTTCNRVCKRTQHVTSNNVGSCWSTILRPFQRSLSRAGDFVVQKSRLSLGASRSTQKKIESPSYPFVKGWFSRTQSGNLEDLIAVEWSS